MKTKRILSIIAAFIFTLIAAFAVIACNDENDTDVFHSVTFRQEGQQDKTIKVPDLGSIKEQDIPSPVQIPGYEVTWEQKDLNNITEDIVVNAVKKVITYNITYDLDGGENGDNPTTYTVESETIVLKPASRSGYEFGGWSRSKNGGDKVTQINQGSYGDICLYATWLKVLNRIYIDDANMPQTVFVKGADLDLSGGMLTVVDSDGIEYVELSDAKVNIRGYDKYKVGKQTLTIDYENQSTTLEITIVERFTFNDKVTRNYVIGEELDIESGNVTVTKDNGTQITNVALDDPRISFGDFDSLAIGEKNVEVTYSDGQEAYKGTLTVKVWAPEGSPRWNTPYTTMFQSHEEFNVSGGYVEFKINGGNDTRRIPFTNKNVQVTGYDPSAVNAQNVEVKQLIHVKYGNYNWEYEITLRYSTISFIKGVAADIIATGIDWTDDEKIGFEEGSGTLLFNAISAAYLYATDSGLTAKDKMYITDNELDNISRVATIAVVEYIFASIEEFYSNAINYTYNSGTRSYEFTIVGESYQAVKTAYDELSEGYGRLINFISYADAIRSNPNLTSVIFVNPMYYGITMGQYLAMLPTTEKVENEVIPVLKIMLDTFDALKSVKTQDSSTWTDAAFDKLYNLLSTTQYKGENYRHIYSLVSSWRSEEQGDMWEAVMRYYWEKNDMEKLAFFADNICMPSELENLYTLVNMVKKHQTELLYYKSETSEYIYYTRMATKALNEIRNKNDEIYSYVVNQIKFHYILYAFDDNGSFVDCLTLPEILNYYYNVDTGYHDAMYALEGYEPFEAMWDTYVAIIDNYINDPTYFVNHDAYYNIFYTERFKNDVKTMFEQFIALSPAEQIGFFISLDEYYVYNYTDMQKIGTNERLIFRYYDVGGFQYASSVDSMFGSFVYSVYASELTSEAQKTALKYLLSSIESFASKDMGKKSANLYYFRLTIESLKEQLTQNLSPAEEQEFRTVMGDILTKYMDYSTMIEQDFNDSGLIIKDIELSAESQALLDRFEEKAQKVTELLETSKNGTKDSAIAFIEEFEELELIVDEIIEKGKTDPELLKKYKCCDIVYTYTDNNDNEVTVRSGYETIYLINLRLQYLRSLRTVEGGK